MLSGLWWISQNNIGSWVEVCRFDNEGRGRVASVNRIYQSDWGRKGWLGMTKYTCRFEPYKFTLRNKVQNHTIFHTAKACDECIVCPAASICSYRYVEHNVALCWIPCWCMNAACWVTIVIQAFFMSGKVQKPQWCFLAGGLLLFNLYQRNSTARKTTIILEFYLSF